MFNCCHSVWCRYKRLSPPSGKQEKCYVANVTCRAIQTKLSVVSVWKRNSPVRRAVLWDVTFGVSVACTLSLWPQPDPLRPSSLDSGPPLL